MKSGGNTAVPRRATRWSRKSLFAFCGLVIAGIGGVPTTVAGAEGPGPGYLTLLFGRSQWVTTDTTCVPRPGAVPLINVADELKARGRTASGTVVVNRTMEDTNLCYGRHTLMASWADLANLRDNYGWTFVSNGMTHNDMTLMTPEEQYAESCGSLPAFTEHGHNDAMSLFAYGNNKFTRDIQTNIVSTCFAYGRTYAGGRNRRAYMQPPWFQKTNSITGRACNDSTQPCYSIQVKNNRRYMSPDTIAGLMAVRPDEWVVVQMYRFVSDSRVSGTGQRWDCTGPDWRLHWTSDPENYCLNDYLAAVDRVPAGVVVTDPATVARAWGRLPAPPPDS